MYCGVYCKIENIAMQNVHYFQYLGIWLEAASDDIDMRDEGNMNQSISLC